MIIREFVEFRLNRIDYVHLLMAGIGGEFSLCGYAHDENASEEEPLTSKFVLSKKRTVTCPDCAREILNCRGVRIDKALLERLIG